MKKLKYIVAVLFLILFTNEGFSLPRFALRQGSLCIDCHINPTGGLMRNKGGWKYGKEVLPLYSPRDSKFLMSNKLADNIEFGLDYRTQYVYSQYLKKTTFQKMEGSVYTNVKLTSKINLLASYDFVNQTWQAYGIAYILPNDSYIKAGTFLPNYGLRLDDHTAYTRGGDLGYLFATGKNQGLIFDPRFDITGAELGVSFSDYTLLTASVGSSTNSINFNTSPVYTVSFQTSPVIANKVSTLLGASFMSFKGSLDYPPYPSFTKVNMYGGFVGFGIDDFTFLSEYDIAKDYESVGTSSSATMLKASYRFIKGVEGIVRYDRFDPNTSINNDAVSRLLVGVEFFPYSFVEVRPQYRFQFENPSVKNDSFVLQFHFFY